MAYEPPKRFNPKRSGNRPDQEIDYGQMDDQACTLSLQPALLRKHNNGDAIEDDYGQTYSAEHSKPWNAVGGRNKKPIFTFQVMSNVACVRGH